MQILQQRLEEAKKAKKALKNTPAPTPLTDKIRPGKTLGSVILPDLNIRQLELMIKIEEAEEEDLLEKYISQYKEELARVQARIKAYSREETPSIRYSENKKRLQNF